MSGAPEIRAILACIDATAGELRIFRRVTAVEALSASRAAVDRAIRHKAFGTLDGLPFAVKENIDIAGLPSQAGLRNAPAPAIFDAPAVARLRAVGAVLIGQTAMDEAALGATTSNPHYGRTANPHRADYTPGGSSGGSAAAVAAGLAALALGTDTLGSVRIPAAYCGIVGFKPTYGRVSRRGIVPLSPSLDHVGLLAQSVAVIRAAFAASAVYDAGDSTLWPMPRGLAAMPALPVIGVPDNIGMVELTPAVRATFDNAVQSLQNSGLTVRRLEMPKWRPAEARKAGFLLIEVEAAAHYAKTLDDPDGPLSANLRCLLDHGRNCSSARLARALGVIAETRRAAAVALADVDVLAMPTCPQTAFPFGTEAPTNQADFTALANLAGLPAISLPLAPIEGDGLPVGLQLVAPAFTDEWLLDISERIAGFLQAPPPPVWTSAAG